MEVEDEIEFTDVAKIFIEDFDKGVDHFEDNEFVFVFVDNGDEVQWGVSFVDDFELLVFDEVAGFGFTSDDELIDLNGGKSTSLRNRCFYCWLKLWEYHLVRRERPCLLMRKKQWIMV